MDAPPERESLDAWLRVARILAATGVHVPPVLRRRIAEQGFVLIERPRPPALPRGARRTARTRRRCTRTRSTRWCACSRGGAGRCGRAAAVRPRAAACARWPCSRTGSSRATSGSRPMPRERAAIAAAFDWLVRRGARAAGRVRASRLPFAQPDGLPAGQSRHRRFPGRGARADQLRPRVAAARTATSSGRARACSAGSTDYRDRRRRSRARRRARTAGEFLRWFDRMGLQRHLKVLGIFARLWHRDGKPGYLADLPRVLDYTLEATARACRSSPNSTHWLRERGRAGIRAAHAARGHRRVEGDDPRGGPRRAHAPADRSRCRSRCSRSGGHRADRVSPRMRSRRPGSRDVVINLSWLGEQIRDGARRRRALRRSRSTTATRVRSRSTPAAASSRALPLLGAEPFLVLNGDVWTDFPLGALASAAGRDRCAHLVLVDESRRITRPAISASSRRTVLRAGATRLTYSGISRARPAAVRRLQRRRVSRCSPCSSARSPQGRLTRRSATRGAWIDVGTPERLAALDAELRLGTAAPSRCCRPRSARMAVMQRCADSMQVTDFKGHSGRQRRAAARDERREVP